MNKPKDSRTISTVKLNFMTHPYHKNSSLDSIPSCESLANPLKIP